MHDFDRFKLYFGPYETPRFRYGQRVWCHYRGWVKIVGLTDGKILWPIGRPTTPGSGRDSVVIYHGLKQAIEKESRQPYLGGDEPSAACYWNGRTVSFVW